MIPSMVALAAHARTKAPDHSDALMDMPLREVLIILAQYLEAQHTHSASPRTSLGGEPAPEGGTG